jgi:phosphate transport system permease protein
MTRTINIRARIASANRRIARLKRIDRGATGIIILGGIGVIVSVVGILVFIAAETWPLFRSAQAERIALMRPVTDAPPPLVIGVDEYQRSYYRVERNAHVTIRRLEGGALIHDLPIPGLEGGPAIAASRSPHTLGDEIAVAAADGRVALAQLRFTPVYRDQRLSDLSVELRPRGLVNLASAGGAIRSVSYSEYEGQRAVAALISDHEIALWTEDAEGISRQTVLSGRPEERLTQVSLGRTETLIAGTDQGTVLHWTLVPEPRLTDVATVGKAPITSLGWILGGSSWVAGNEDGDVSGWFRARLTDEAQERSLLRAHVFPKQDAAVTAIAPSTRDKSFLTVGRNGTLVYRFFTNERTLLTLPAGGSAPRLAVITPKNDGLLVLAEDGSLGRYALRSPHPEVTWKALFGKVWYEGYAAAQYVWQSTGATNDFETKLSLTPLIFGTIKGTVYALLFAVPIAVGGALYTSQFVHPSIKAKVKPAVEIMAALPSVVVGFIAGLWLAPVIERNVVAMFLMLPVLPVMGMSAIFLASALPRSLRRLLKPGSEVFLIVPMLLLGAWIAVASAPWVERLLFAGDFRLWLAQALGLTYDPRNCLVIGVAMGFAVIPIIFTISEDAFSSVPSSLTAASLALGASRWQTALRIVLPTASPGVFSAVMIGFGRAVGETMIVLMATGNTPVLDWSIFNGMRTLSANIAVEIPEAPHAGTLYRVLFLAAAVLFALTFAVNTVAELIRQRLREKYRAL